MKHNIGQNVFLYMHGLHLLLLIHPKTQGLLVSGD